MNEIKDKVQEIFRDVFDDESLELHEDLSADDVEAWDSLSHIRLVMALEKEFQVKFSFEELHGMKNVGDMLRVIQEKLSD